MKFLGGGTYQIYLSSYYGQRACDRRMHAAPRPEGPWYRVHASIASELSAAADNVHVHWI